MKELYDIIMALIPYIPWLVGAYAVRAIYKHKPKYAEFICGKIFKIKSYR